MSSVSFLGIFLLACILMLPVPGAGQELISGGTIPLHFPSETVSVTIDQGRQPIGGDTTRPGSADLKTGDPAEGWP